MRKKEKAKDPNYERYTIFNALLEAMNEKKQRKSKLRRFVDWTGLRR
jgi:hypothetical protein